MLIITKLMTLRLIDRCTDYLYMMQSTRSQLTTGLKKCTHLVDWYHATGNACIIHPLPIMSDLRETKATTLFVPHRKQMNINSFTIYETVQLFSLAGVLKKTINLHIFVEFF
jgi:hypothetical protein